MSEPSELSQTALHLQNTWLFSATSSVYLSVLKLHAKIASVTMQTTVLLWASKIKKITLKFSIRPLSLDRGSWFGPSDIAVLLPWPVMCQTLGFQFFDSYFILCCYWQSVIPFHTGISKSHCDYFVYSIYVLFPHIVFNHSNVVYVKAVKCFCAFDTGNSLLAKYVSWDETLCVPVWPLLCLEWARRLHCSISLWLQGQPKTYLSMDARMVLVLHSKHSFQNIQNFIPNIFCGISTGWFWWFFPVCMRHNYIPEFKFIFARNVFDWLWLGKTSQ